MCAPKVFKINNIIIQYKIQTVQSSGESTFLLPPLSGTLLISPENQGYNFLRCPSWALLYICRPMYAPSTHAHMEGSLACAPFCILFFTLNNIYVRVCSTSVYTKSFHSFHGCIYYTDRYTIIYSSSPLLMDFWVVSNLLRLQIIFQWIHLYTCHFTHLHI